MSKVTINNDYSNDYKRLSTLVLTNLATPKRPVYNSAPPSSAHVSSSGVASAADQMQIHSSAGKPLIDWAPSFAEIDSLITGEPLVIQVYTPVGDIFSYHVDETTTVETLLTQHIWKEKYFQKEPDSEVYWLFKLVDKSDQFDQPLPKDRKILKILYKTEKQNSKRTSESSDLGSKQSLLGQTAQQNANEERFKTSKFLRKQTI